ncbi:MAG: DUF1772 domain-containing protein [Taibaiella sp.]|jgi:uncharacterized membrane protein
MNIKIARFIGLLATGLLAGAFFYALLNVIPTFYEVPVPVHLIFRTQLMTHNGITMQTLMAFSIITPFWYARLYKHFKTTRNLAYLSAVFALSSLLVTRFGNVPINQIIKTWVNMPSPPSHWQSALHQWDVYHAIRTVCALLCFILFIAATRMDIIKTVEGKQPG